MRVIRRVSGRLVWLGAWSSVVPGTDGRNAIVLPAGTTGIPMTYLVNGRQYVVVAVGGEGHPAELAALAVSGVGHVYVDIVVDGWQSVVNWFKGFLS